MALMGDEKHQTDCENFYNFCFDDVMDNVMPDTRYRACFVPFSTARVNLFLHCHDFITLIKPDTH